MGAHRHGSPPPPPRRSYGIVPLHSQTLAQQGSLPRSSSASLQVGWGSGSSTRPYFTPDPLFYVWLEGLPASGFSFHAEYVEPCQRAYGTVFEPDRSFLVDRHDLGSTPGMLTWGVLAFNDAEIAQQCGMLAALGPLVPNSLLPHPPHRITVRRRIPAQQEELDALAKEIARQEVEKADARVSAAIVDADRRRAIGKQQQEADRNALGAQPQQQQQQQQQPPLPAEVPPPPPLSPPRPASSVPPPPPQPADTQPTAGVVGAYHHHQQHCLTELAPADMTFNEALSPLPADEEFWPDGSPEQDTTPDAAGALLLSAAAAATSPPMVQPVSTWHPAQPASASAPAAAKAATTEPATARSSAVGTAAVTAPAVAEGECLVAAVLQKVAAARIVDELGAGIFFSRKPLLCKQQQSQHTRLDTETGQVPPTWEQQVQQQQQQLQRTRPGSASGSAGVANKVAVAGGGNPTTKSKKRVAVEEPVSSPCNSTGSFKLAGQQQPHPQLTQCLSSPHGSRKSGAATAGAAAAAADIASPPDDNVRQKVRINCLEVPLQLAAEELQQEGGGNKGEQQRKWTPAFVAAAAAKLEEVLLEAHSGQTNKAYKERARTLKFNLKENRELRAHMLRGDIPATTFVRMTADELATKDLREYRKYVREESLRQAVLPPELAAIKSTAAAVELKQAGLLPGIARMSWGSTASSTGLPEASPSPPGTAEAEVLAGMEQEQGAVQAMSPVHISLHPIRASPLTSLLGSSLKVFSKASRLGTGGDGSNPLPAISKMPAYDLPPGSPHFEGRGGYVSGGSPNSAAAAAVWDFDELAGQQKLKQQQQKQLQAGGRAGTPDLTELPESPQQEQKQQQREGTADLKQPPPAAAPPPQQPGPPPPQQQQDLSPEEQRAWQQQRQQKWLERQQEGQGSGAQQQRAGTPDLWDEDELPSHAPQKQQQQQPHNAARTGTPDLFDNNELVQLQHTKCPAASPLAASDPGSRSKRDETAGMQRGQGERSREKRRGRSSRDRSRSKERHGSREDNQWQHTKEEDSGRHAEGRAHSRGKEDERWRYDQDSRRDGKLRHRRSRSRDGGGQRNRSQAGRRPQDAAVDNSRHGRQQGHKRSRSRSPWRPADGRGSGSSRCAISPPPPKKQQQSRQEPAAPQPDPSNHCEPWTANDSFSGGLSPLEDEGPVTAGNVFYAPLRQQPSVLLQHFHTAQEHFYQLPVEHTQAQLSPLPLADAGAFWQGQLHWPHFSAPHLQLSASALSWQAPTSMPQPMQLPQRLTVTMTIPGKDLLPMLERHGARPGQVCCFLLTARGGRCGRELMSARDLQEGKVGCCLVNLKGDQVPNDDAMWQRRETHAWFLHLLVPTPEAMFYAGVDKGQVTGLGPGTLLVLALPAWHGLLYSSTEKKVLGKPDCCVRMIVPPLLHLLPPELVVPHTLRTSVWQFQKHRAELMGQRMLVKPRKTPRDQEGMASCSRFLTNKGKCLVLPLHSRTRFDGSGAPLVVAELLLIPTPDSRLQAAIWEPDGGPVIDREVFDPWVFTLD